MDRGAWWATVHRVTKSWTQLSDQHSWKQPRVSHHVDFPLTLSEQTLEKSQKDRVYEKEGSLNLFSKVITHPLCCILFIKVKSVVQPIHTQS